MTKIVQGPWPKADLPPPGDNKEIIQLIIDDLQKSIDGIDLLMVTGRLKNGEIFLNINKPNPEELVYHMELTKLIILDSRPND